MRRSKRSRERRPWLPSLGSGNVPPKRARRTSPWPKSTARSAVHARPGRADATLEDRTRHKRPRIGIAQSSRSARSRSRPGPRGRPDGSRRRSHPRRISARLTASEVRFRAGRHRRRHRVSGKEIRTSSRAADRHRSPRSQRSAVPGSRAIRIGRGARHGKHQAFPCRGPLRRCSRDASPFSEEAIDRRSRPIPLGASGKLRRREAGPGWRRAASGPARTTLPASGTRCSGGSSR